MRHRLMSGLMWVLLCASAGAAPATRPAALLPRVRELLLRLNDDDSSTRQDARMKLMGLSRGDLPTLRQAMKDSLPLQPAQKAVLRDIVTHIYLAGDTYPAGESGFMGVRLPSWSRPEERPLLSIERGVAIVSRIPGFCAFRVLQDGDVLLSIAGDPDIQLNSPDQLIDAVRNIPAGQTVVFEVLRQGQLIKVRLTLDPKPEELQNGNGEQFLGQRSDSADQVWQRDFEPLLGELVG